MAKRLIPSLNRILMNSAKVVAVGPGAHDRNGVQIPVCVKEGDTVLLPEYGGTQVKLGEKDQPKLILCLGRSEPEVESFLSFNAVSTDQNPCLSSGLKVRPDLTNHTTRKHFTK
ncbi:Chaperonin Cpn10 [Macleaya cordata]|uniref:Chaperonin Cpn10 n=1 Tax=Macleaya cordata TaxID=56857 RepID=A0A200R756_MACCD|nr:Chaperonin Cpn10 [Macleaya cordata]